MGSFWRVRCKLTCLFIACVQIACVEAKDHYIVGLFKNALAGRFRSPCASQMAKALADTLVAQNEFSIEFPLRLFKFQRELSRRLLELTYPDDVHKTILKRCVKYFPELSRGLSLDIFLEFKPFATSLTSAISFQCLRSLCNAWCTSRRFSEITVLPALCGCSSVPDFQMHYSYCPRFWALISLIDSFALPVSPLHALCVLGPSPRAALRVYVLSTAYHAIKAVSLQRVLKRIAGQNGFALAIIWGDAL